MAAEIRLANEVSWRELPPAWNAKRVMSVLKSRDGFTSWRTLVSGERSGCGPRFCLIPENLLTNSGGG
jgi:hypothetical protein